MKKNDNLLKDANRFCKKITVSLYVIDLEADTKKINSDAIALFYHILNSFENMYFITIKNIPYCLMPDAVDHLIYFEKDNVDCYHDKICHVCDFHDRCAGWRDDFKVNIDHLRPYKDIPNEIVIETTNQCNLRCQTCAIDKSKPLNQGSPAIERIIKECKAIGITAMRFTGGEPLLNPQIKNMLLSAKRNSLFVILNTNATRIDETMFKIVSRNVDNILISLQGYDQSSDSYLTGSDGDFSKKISNIVKLKSIIPLTRIGTVISKTLISNLSKYYSLLKKIGIENWELYRPISGISNSEFKLTKNDLLKVMRFCYVLKNKGLKVKIANPVPFCISKDINLSLSVLLGAIPEDGNSRLVWDAKGFFKPSYFIDIPLGRTIKEAWENKTLKSLRSLRFLATTCKSCQYIKWCRGGSRAIAKICFGSYFDKDPLSPKHSRESYQL